MDLGLVAEGIIELDPMTGRLVIRCEEPGGFRYVDVQEVLEKYRGQEVRFILVPLSTIDQIGQMVESGKIEIDGVPCAGGRQLV
jgi:hypothetical protein